MSKSAVEAPVIAAPVPSGAAADSAARPGTGRPPERQAEAARLRFDLGTLLGLLAGFGLIAAAIKLDGSVLAFLNLPGLLIVLGGTLAVVTVSFSLPDTLTAIATMPRAVIYFGRDVRAASVEMLQLADTARRDNLIGLERLLPRLAGDRFLYKAIAMACEGTPGDAIEAVMRRELSAIRLRHQRSTAILRRAAEVAPAMGLIGTLIGLVQMLGRLQDPSAIGPAMAIALLGTLYGAVLAHMVFNPLATKLERNSSEESLVKTIYLLGAGAIGRHEHPRRLERTINALLPPSKRVRLFDEF
jgi:chemotaxis protein MotA